MGEKAALSAALEGRYHLERELGAGGMATVYLARDMRRDRDVALKVLRTGVAQALGRERIAREIRLAARLNHPHILPLYDSGEAGGFLYFVMPVMQGQTLRDRLRQEGARPIDEAVRLAADVADALDYAHRHAVVHRDIKPENILLHEGHAVVADFGIGKVQLSSSEDARLGSRRMSAPRAFELYLQARSELRRHGASTDHASLLLERAIDIEGPTPPLRALQAYIGISKIRGGASTRARTARTGDRSRDVPGPFLQRVLPVHGTAARPAGVRLHCRQGGAPRGRVREEPGG